MADDLQNLDELVSELEGLAIRTSAGSFVKMEDIRRLTEKRKEARSITEAEAPKNIHEARAQAKEYLKTQGVGPQHPLEPGRAISARPTEQPHPPSRA